MQNACRLILGEKLMDDSTLVWGNFHTRSEIFNIQCSIFNVHLNIEHCELNVEYSLDLLPNPVFFIHVAQFFFELDADIFHHRKFGFAQWYLWHRYYRNKRNAHQYSAYNKYRIDGMSERLFGRIYKR